MEVVVLEPLTKAEKMVDQAVLVEQKQLQIDIGLAVVTLLVKDMMVVDIMVKMLVPTQQAAAVVLVKSV
jgi:hypothetical protein